MGKKILQTHTQICYVLHLYGIQEQAKLIGSNKSQNSGYLLMASGH